MSEHIYKIVEVTGSSKISMEHAIQNAITRASKTLRDLRWFEVIDTRGYVENAKIAYWQVTLKIGFNLEEP